MGGISAKLTVYSHLSEQTTDIGFLLDNETED